MNVSTRNKHAFAGRARNSLKAGLQRPGLRRAFTAFEMLTASTILAVLAAVAVTSMAPGQVQNLQSVTAVLASDLDYARSLAVQYNTQWSVQFDLTNNTYSLVYAGAGTQPFYPVNARGRGDAASATYLVPVKSLGQSSRGDNGVRLAGMALKTTQQNVTTVTFGPLGNLPSQSQDTVIWLTYGAGSSMKFSRITVSWVTGQVWVDQPDMFTSPTQVFK